MDCKNHAYVTPGNYWATIGGTDPQTYLRDVLTRLPTLTNWQIKDVTPEAWAKAQPLTAQRHAA